MNKLFKS